jgi:hypothetical protein
MKCLGKTESSPRKNMLQDPLSWSCDKQCMESDAQTK